MEKVVAARTAEIKHEVHILHSNSNRLVRATLSAGDAKKDSQAVFWFKGKGAMTDRLTAWIKSKGFRMPVWYLPSLPYGV